MTFNYPAHKKWDPIFFVEIGSGKTQTAQAWLSPFGEKLTIVKYQSSVDIDDTKLKILSSFLFSLWSILESALTSNMSPFSSSLLESVSSDNQHLYLKGAQCFTSDWLLFLSFHATIFWRHDFWLGWRIRRAQLIIAFLLPLYFSV